MHWLNILSTELHLRLTEAREDSPGLWVRHKRFSTFNLPLTLLSPQPKTITFTHRSPTFVIRSHQIPFPFTSNLTINYILRHAEKLFRTAIGTQTSTGPPPTFETPIGPYSNVQLSFSGLERLEEGQRGIEGFFAAQMAKGADAQGPGDKEKKRKEPDTVGGEDGSAPEAKPAKKRKGAKSAKDGGKNAKSRSPSITVQPDGTEQLTLSSDSEDDAGPPSPRPLPTAKCDECGKKLVIPADAKTTLAKGGWKEDEVKSALEKEQSEHADFHVAKAILGASHLLPALARMLILTVASVWSAAEKERKANGWGSGGSTSGGAKTTSLASANGNSKKGSKKQAKASKKEKEREKGKLTGFFDRKG